MSTRSVISRLICFSMMLIALSYSTGIAHAHPETDASGEATHLVVSPQLPDAESLISGQVVRVFDADTLLIRIEGKNRRYQLLGADAPELMPKGRASKPYSVESRQFMVQLLLGEEVYIQHDPKGERDSAGRRSAYVFRAPDMLFVNLELVRQGYAKYNPHHVTLYAESFAYYQTKAKTLFKGIWDPNFPTQTIAEVEDADERIVIKQTPPELENTVERSPTTESNKSSQSKSSTVYITKSGSKYHLKGCSHLTSSQRPTTRKEIKSTHKPCKSCNPDES